MNSAVCSQLWVEEKHYLHEQASSLPDKAVVVEIGTAQGGKIALHDYDPVQRGGCAHIGVKVFVDAVISLGILEDTEHAGRIFAGRKARSGSHDEMVGECYRSWKKIGQNVSDFKKLDFEQYDIAGREDAFSGMLRELRDLRGNPVEAPSKHLKQNVLILPKSPPEMVQDMSEKDGVVLLDELTFFYLLWDSMINKRDRILEMAKDRGGIFKWEELMEMLDHAAGFSGGIDDVFSVKSGTLEDLSRICARELVRISMLKNIFLSITENPALGK